MLLLLIEKALSKSKKKQKKSKKKKGTSADSVNTMSEIRCYNKCSKYFSFSCL